MYIHLPCEDRSIRNKRKIFSEIYMVYADTKRPKLLAKCDDMLEKTIL